MTGSGHIIKLENVVKNYGRIRALDASEFTLARGSVTAVVGPNGSGKTTLLETMAGLLKPDSGSVLLNGESVYASRQDAARARSAATMTFQSPVLFGGTVMSNVSYPFRVRNRDGKNEIPAKVSQLLEKVGLAGFENRRADELSGGEMQRTSIARALATGAETFLFDEPTGSIDREYVAVIMDLITSLSRDEGKTVLFTTHHLGLALEFAGDVYTIYNGRLIPGAAAENMFSGTLSVSGEKMRVSLRTGVELEIDASGCAPGPCRVTLAAEKLQIAAPGGGGGNVLEGTLVALFLENDVLKATVETGGLRITAVLPKDSVEESALVVGKNVALVIPPAAVNIHTDG